MLRVCLAVGQLFLGVSTATATQPAAYTPQTQAAFFHATIAVSLPTALSAGLDASSQVGACIIK